MPSFDVVSEIDTHELTNAVDQAIRELSQRFDFKGTDAQFELEDTTVTVEDNGPASNVAPPGNNPAIGFPAKADAILKASKVYPVTNYTVTNLAEIRKIITNARQSGYALADQELGIGLRSVAVPIFARDGPIG